MRNTRQQTRRCASLCACCLAHYVSIRCDDKLVSDYNVFVKKLNA